MHPLLKSSIVALSLGFIAFATLVALPVPAARLPRSQASQAPAKLAVSDPIEGVRSAANPSPATPER